MPSVLSPEGPDIVRISSGAAAEGRGPGNEHSGARVNRLPRGVGINPPIDLDASVEAALRDTVRDGFDLLELARDELLSS